MTDNIAVKVQNVSKMYRLFASKGDRVREALHPFRHTYHHEFWALKDINLEIPSGRTVGILGLNGSGKSTLLQIICSILQPTSGTVQVNGKVAALLELGAGFNRELTGRENVILNGTIMGLNREQIAVRMEDVEAFADIGEFFDQPMKTYSSGMFMRVAFSTALYVDPDVLVIDEVLAVGDAKFQQKCFRRFKGFQEAGGTILLVTHDRASVSILCDLAILLHRGRLVHVGEPRRVVDLYSEILSFGDVWSKDAMATEGIEATANPPSNAWATKSAINLGDPERSWMNTLRAFLSDMSSQDRCHHNSTYNKYEHRFGNNRAVIVDYLIAQGDKINPTAVVGGQTVDVYVKVLFKHDIQNPKIGIAITNKQGVTIHGTHSGWLNTQTPDVRSKSVHAYKFSVQLNLAQGAWFLTLGVAETQSNLCEVRCNVACLEVIAARPFDGLAMLDMTIQPLN